LRIRAPASIIDGYERPAFLPRLLTTPLELISFVLSIATVLLNIRRIHWAWLFAIVSSAPTASCSSRPACTATPACRAVFIVASIWGWYEWLRGTGRTTSRWW
jgi:nicotinamide mononucleotide transporter